MVHTSRVKVLPLLLSSLSFLALSENNVSHCHCHCHCFSTAFLVACWNRYLLHQKSFFIFIYSSRLVFFCFLILFFRQSKQLEYFRYRSFISTKKKMQTIETNRKRKTMKVAARKRMTGIERSQNRNRRREYNQQYIIRKVLVVAANHVSVALNSNGSGN